MTMTTSVDEKGRITIPIAVRIRHKLKTGDVMLFINDKEIRMVKLSQIKVD